MYRLPTEAEWEYAARAGTTTPWYFGGSPDTIDKYEWTLSNSESTREIGTRGFNPWGLYDMLGNVKEIVSDFYDLEYYEDSPSIDPTGPKRDLFKSRVVRGGAWYNTPERARSSYRYFLDNDTSDLNIGFRLAFTDNPNLPDNSPKDVPSTDEFYNDKLLTDDSQFMEKITGKNIPKNYYDISLQATDKGYNYPPKSQDPTVEKFSKIKNAFDAKSDFRVKIDKNE
jgi:hypothetical protein